MEENMHFINRKQMLRLSFSHLEFGLIAAWMCSPLCVGAATFPVGSETKICKWAIINRRDPRWTLFETFLSNQPLFPPAAVSLLCLFWILAFSLGPNEYLKIGRRHLDPHFGTHLADALSFVVVVILMCFFVIKLWREYQKIRKRLLDS